VNKYTFETFAAEQMLQSERQDTHRLIYLVCIVSAKQHAAFKLLSVSFSHI